jgi:hypothetical protein|tara:strand:+ start:533 stop:637 length:105 start_codon:yes stop_codon:yes gene_type:complete
MFEDFTGKEVEKTVLAFLMNANTIKLTMVSGKKE